MCKQPAARSAVLGLDVGKFSHWACLVTGSGEIVANAPVANAEADLDELFSKAGAGTLVVVDQVRNIGSPTCPGSPPIRPQGCSRAMPRPTSATRW